MGTINNKKLEKALTEVLQENQANTSGLAAALVTRVLSESWVCKIPDKFEGFLIEPYDYELREEYFAAFNDEESSRFSRASEKTNRLGMYGYHSLKDIEEAEEL